MSRWIFAFAMLLMAASSAPAHFVFIVPDSGTSSAKVVMSESLAADDDIDIEIIGGTKLSVRSPGGADAAVVLQKSGHAYTIAVPGNGTRIIHGITNLGISRRGNSTPFLLVYHPKTIVGDPFDPKTTLGEAARAEIIPVGKPGAIHFKVLLKGAPLEDVEVNLILPDGSHQKVKTDKEGQTAAFEPRGRYGAWVRCVEKSAGEHNGERYEEIRHYPTLVADISAAPAAARPTALRYGTLPETTSSFGAVVSDGWLYVYGGHVVPTHVYSTEAVSGRFHRLNLADGKTWQELPVGPGLQGLNLAAWSGKIYRAGGMKPRNAPKTKPDNISIADCAQFDPAVGKWETLPPLPEPRSSHDVAVVDGKLYAVGGWTMKGPKGDDWLETMAVLDLKADKMEWEHIKQPFKRRAMVAASYENKLYVIGGFTDDDEATLAIEIYDPATKKWSKGVDLPGPSGNGFAPAAGTLNGALYVSVADGTLYRLNSAEKTWSRIGTSTPRIVHRLAADKTQILLLGGAAKGDTLNLIEAIPIKDANVPAGEK